MGIKFEDFVWAREEGREAYQARMPALSNPYVQRSYGVAYMTGQDLADLWRAWQAGWLREERVTRRLAREAAGEVA